MSGQAGAVFRQSNIHVSKAKLCTSRQHAGYSHKTRRTPVFRYPPVRLPARCCQYFFFTPLHNVRVRACKREGSRTEAQARDGEAGQ